MIDVTSFWLTPLILLPGVALLILSTSVRLNRLHDEVHELLDHEESSPRAMRLLMRRAQRFRNALVSLYVCVALFAVASLLGMMAALWESESSVWTVLGIASVGIVCLAFAAFELIRESFYAVDIIKEHEHQIDESPTGSGGHE